jgi:hypothetical protein
MNLKGLRALRCEFYDGGKELDGRWRKYCLMEWKK